jgi:tricorn protease
MVAYSGELEGIRELYVMPVAGGPPKRLTYLNEFADMVDWRDANTVMFRARNYPSGTAPTLFTIDVRGAEPVRLPLEFASFGSFAPDGNQLVFNRFQRFTNAWFRYQGGLKNPLWLADIKNLKFTKIHEGQGSCEFPVWNSGRIYFTTQEGGDFSIGSVRPDGGDARRETDPSAFEMRYLQGDGKRLVFERGRGVEVFDPESRKTVPIAFDMASDYLHTRPYMVPADANVIFASIGPTGKRVLVETRGQIISLPVKDGDARVVLAKDGVRFRNPVYSPDGKKIAFFSDELGEQQLMVSDADGQNAKQLTNGEKRQLRRIHWAPDSKTIAYTTNDRFIRLVDLERKEKTVFKGGNWNWDAAELHFSPDSKWLAIGDIELWTGVTTLTLYDIAGEKLHRIGVGQVDDFSARFSPDGKYLAFLSRRNLALRFDPIQNQINLNNDLKVYVLTLAKDTPSPVLPKEVDEGVAEPKEEEKKPFRIDLDGLYGRFTELPLTPANYTQLEWAGDRLVVREGTANELRYYDLKTRKSGLLAANAPTYAVSDDGKKVLIGAGSTLRVVDATGENDTRVDYAGLQLRVDPVAEWKQIYWDAWRLTRDYFYVANMHGADWEAIGRKYAAFLPSVRSRDELDQLIRWMQAELSISHSFLSPGDVRSLVRPAKPSFLGVDLEPAENGYYRIKKIFRGMEFVASERSPLAEPGVAVSEGDYLIEVGGRPAKVGTPWREALLGRAGQLVALKVNSAPSEVGARVIKVKPAPNETRMRWWDWVEARKKYVDQASGGKLAYVYLRAMVLDDMSDFIRQYYPQRVKQGLIMDTRFNTGGNISNHLITVLRQTGISFWNQRNADTPWTRQGDFFPGPMACLQNEFNYSNGEEFPFYFKAMKLGPVIGRRTRGGEVGSDPGWPLVDGGVISVPNYGMFTEKGWEIEGRGVDPDIDVLSDPNAWARGKDPQLDKAIEYLMEQIRKNPFKRPAQPADPVYIKPGGKG